MVEVLALQNGCGCAGPEGGARVQKKRALGSLQKKYFSALEKDGFFALFENRQKTPVSINKDGRLMKMAFLVFVPKRVKNRLKINIASNLP